mmetsp:Transcript_64452/g.172600  ORF Transcript_64452/g.172600 Transcript_64452/m.172600 type:complete len:85 (+) Transcript_64452:492-746(+)
MHFELSNVSSLAIGCSTDNSDSLELKRENVYGSTIVKCNQCCGLVRAMQPSPGEAKIKQRRLANMLLVSSYGTRDVENSVGSGS